MTESGRGEDFSKLGNWIQDNLDVDHSTASEMAEAALDVKYGKDWSDHEPEIDCPYCDPGEMYRDGSKVVCDSCGGVKLA